jgi:hypothetical protein
VERLLWSGSLTDLALAVIAFEAIVLLVVHRRSGLGLGPLDVAGQLAAGAMLLLALRCAVTGASYLWTLGFVAASLPAHLFDLLRRVRSVRVTIPG